MSLLGPSSSAPLITATTDDGPLAYGAPDPVLNVFNSGLLPEPTHRNPTSSYYLSAGQPISEDLVSPVNILSADLSKSATISVDSANGSMAISPAGNPLAPAPARYGMNLESGAGGVIVSIGDSTIASTPTLQLKGQVTGVPTTGVVFDSVYNQVNKITSAPVVNTITPANFVGPSGTIRPLFYDTTTNNIVVSNGGGLFRFFQVATPVSTGVDVTITDPLGNTYSDPDWICCVAGFANPDGDRTYNAVTIQVAGSPWTVRYDNAGTTAGSYVNILAIHRSMLTIG